MSQDPPPSSSPAKIPRPGSTVIFSWRGAAKLVAVAATVFVLSECTSFAILQLLALRDRTRLSGDEATPVYRNEPWADAYWREHRRFLARSYEAYPYGLWRSPPFS